VEEYCRAKQATNYNMLHVPCMLVKKGYRHTPNMKYLLLVHSNNGYLNMPQRYVIRTLPVLLYRRRDVQALYSKNPHAVTKSFRIRGVWQFHMYSPFKKSGKSRQSFHHRHAQASLTTVVWWQQTAYTL